MGMPNPQTEAKPKKQTIHYTERTKMDGLNHMDPAKPSNIYTPVGRSTGRRRIITESQ